MQDAKETIILTIDIYNRALEIPGSSDSMIDLVVFTVILAIIIMSICYAIMPAADPLAMLGPCLIIVLIITASVVQEAHKHKHPDTPSGIYQNPGKAAKYGLQHNAKPISLLPLFENDTLLETIYNRTITECSKTDTNLHDKVVVTMIHRLRLLSIEASVKSNK